MPASSNLGVSVPSAKSVFLMVFIVLDGGIDHLISSMSTSMSPLDEPCWVSLFSEQGALGRPRHFAWRAAAPGGLVPTNKCDSWGRRQRRQRQQRRWQSQRQPGLAPGRIGEAINDMT